MDAMQSDAALAIDSLKVDGGACANNFLMQFQADMLNVPVKRPTCVESTALGAAFLAGLAVGYWKNQDSLVQNQHVERVFSPDMEEKTRMQKRRGWEKAVRCAYGWAKEEGDSLS